MTSHNDVFHGQSRVERYDFIQLADYLQQLSLTESIIQFGSMPETWSGIMTILQDADEFLADPGNWDVSKRLSFAFELKELEPQGVQKKLIKITEENGNLKISNEGLRAPSESAGQWYGPVSREHKSSGGSDPRSRCHQQPL